MGKHSRHDPEEDTQLGKRSKDVPSISEEDYYEKANEFRLWLKEAKHKYIDELSSKESRRYFKKFVKKWNDNQLADKFYKGMSSAQLGSSDTTRYKWSFAKKLNQFELDSVRDNVDSMTNQSRGDDKVAAGRRRNVGPSMPTNTFDKEEAQERGRADRKYESRRSKDRREAMLDEVAPRETGREAAIAKKRALNAYHKREKSPDVELSEADLMGGDDFQARLAQERKHQERRENRMAEKREQKLAPILSKMDAYKAKEDATMAMFKQMAEEQRKRGGL